MSTVRSQTFVMDRSLSRDDVLGKKGQNGSIVTRKQQFMMNYVGRKQYFLRFCCTKTWKNAWVSHLKHRRLEIRCWFPYLQKNDFSFFVDGMCRWKVFVPCINTGGLREPSLQSILCPRLGEEWIGGSHGCPGRLWDRFLWQVYQNDNRHDALDGVL